MTNDFRNALVKEVRAKGRDLDLPAFFRQQGITNKVDGEQLFKKAVTDFTKFKKKDDAKTWAKAILADNFTVSQKIF